MSATTIFLLLQSLINAFGPCGQEDEVLHGEVCGGRHRPAQDGRWKPQRFVFDRPRIGGTEAGISGIIAGSLV